MVSLSERYRRGEYKAVWRELDHSWIDGIRFRVPAPSQDDVEDVMRQTFERVARNVDRLIERLRDIGYAFECERDDNSRPLPPRRPVDLTLFGDANAALARRFEGLLRPGFPTPGLPAALVWFGRIVGAVDLGCDAIENRESWLVRPARTAPDLSPIGRGSQVGAGRFASSRSTIAGAEPT